MRMICPDVMSFNAFFVRRIGNGQFNPRASTSRSACNMEAKLRKGYQRNDYTVGRAGKISWLRPREPLQVIPVGRNAHSIRTDESNKFVYVPTLGSDQVFQFTFDEKSGRLSSNTPPLVLLKQSTRPRHFVTSADNKFVYVLSVNCWARSRHSRWTAKPVC